MVSAPYELQWYRVRAYSHHTDIPVHTVDYHAAAKLQALVDKGQARHIPGSGYALDAMVFTRGELPPPVLATPAPLQLGHAVRPKLDLSSDFEASAGTIVCVLVICVDVLLFGVIFAMHRNSGVQLPHEVRVTGFAIPLKMLSTGLSLSLLLIIAMVTFSLATVAGQDSTDKAMENGRKALGLSYTSSSSNTLVLSEHVRDLIIDRVLLSLESAVVKSEARLDVVESLFYDFDGSWAEFEKHFLPLFRIQRTVEGYTDPLLQIYTTRGFFMNQHWKTDTRSDALRDDGVVGTVAETEEGWRYGFSFFEINFISRTPNYILTLPVTEFNASRVVAGNIGDPLLLTAAKPARHTQWLPCKLYFPLRVQEQRPLSAYRPLYGKGGQYHGTVEAFAQVHNFIGKALDTERLRQGNLENMSVLVIDDTNKAILGSHNIHSYDPGADGGGLSKIEALVWTHKLEAMYGVYYMHTHPTLRVAVLSSYFDAQDAWKGDHAGEFNQQDYFREQEFFTLAKITPSGGRVADAGYARWEVEMRDGACGDCVVYDDQLRKEVMVFDGHTTMHIYRNLTRRTPIVATSQVSDPGQPWRSRYEVFNEAMVLGDGRECVSYTHHSPSGARQRCMLRPDFTVHFAFSVSMQIRPDVAYTETAPGDTTPRLLADSLVGEGNMRLFANGQLYLLVLKYGCRTQAYPGGFPVHAWTTVTVVVGLPTCRVYVNGTLHSEGIDARLDDSHRIHAEPYRSGQHFKGRIDNMQFFSSWIPTPAEVMFLHMHGRMVREVVSQDLFAQKKPLEFTKDGSVREGLQWSVAVMIPRADIMRVVDANRMATLSDVQIQEANTNKELKQKANATIMIIVALAMTSVVVFLVFNNMITRPFEATAVIMAEAAVLRIDSIPRDNSPITELRAMNTAIRLMLQNLKLYKSFMPQSVKLDDETDMSASFASEGRMSMSLTQSMSVASSGSLHSLNGQKRAREMVCSLSKRKFTYMVMNVRKWHQRIASLTDSEVLGMHSVLLEAFLHNVLINKGVAEVFSGDRFACTFNAAKPAAQHRPCGSLAAMKCSGAVKDIGERCSCSVVSGEGRVGNMGNDSMRRFSFVTPVVTWGHALERLCNSHDLLIMVDYTVYSDVQYTHVLRVIDAVSFPKLQEMPIPVLELVGSKKNAGGDEWMYELQAGEESDPMAAWNKCAFQIMRDVSEVTEEMPDIVDAQVCKATNRLVQAFVTRNYEPFEVQFH